MGAALYMYVILLAPGGTQSQVHQLMDQQTSHTQLHITDVELLHPPPPPLPSLPPPEMFTLLLNLECETRSTQAL